MMQLVRYILDRLPYIGRLRKRVRNLEINHEKYLEMESKLEKYLEMQKDQGIVPAGTYYSPIPNRDDVLEYIKSPKRKNIDLPEINLNKESQFKLLQEYQKFYNDLPFPEEKGKDCRYYYTNDWFGYSDAIFLYSFLRKNKPRKIIEVGSGFSSAVILDTVEKFLNHQTEINFIEPYPERLISILNPEDRKKIQIIDKKVQDSPIDIFTSLGPGDLLFIDSTHVVKCGSDVQLLMFEIIPKLSPGVFVHFHDIFFPFEYPADWLTRGIYWNEDYFLRSFLAYNSQWIISFFNPYAGIVFRDFLEEKMPLCLKIENTGGSIYIQKTAPFQKNLFPPTPDHLRGW